MKSFIVKPNRQLSRCAVVWLTLLLVGSAFADNSKISPDLLPLLTNPSNSVNVIVQYNSSLTSGGIIGGIINLLGDAVNATFSLIPADSATMTAANVLTLSNQASVSYISLDRPLNATLDYSAAAVNAPFAWNSGLDGTGVGIAIIDSGVYSHPDLTAANSSKSRVVYRQNFIGGVQYDDYGHGTHVAGIAAGNGSSSSQPGAFRTFRGIAPMSSLMAPESTLAGLYPGDVVPTQYTTAINAPSGRYIHLSGTSMATPVVSGAAALLLQREPTLSPDTVKARLMKTAYKTFPLASVATDPTTGAVYPSTYDIFTVGAGYLDIGAALTNSDTAYYT